MQSVITIDKLNDHMSVLNNHKILGYVITPRANEAPKQRIVFIAGRP